MQRHCRRLANPRAFTIVEAIVSSVVMAVMLVTSVRAITSISKSRGSLLVERQATLLCKDLMTEIMQCYYTLPTGSVDGISRASWITISDYNGFSELPPSTISGTPITGYDGWTRTVLVELVNPAAPNGSAVVTDMGLKRITVTVTNPKGRSASLVALRSSVGFYERKPTTQMSMTSQIKITLDGGGTAKSSAAVDLNNQVP